MHSAFPQATVEHESRFLDDFGVEEDEEAEQLLQKAKKQKKGERPCIAEKPLHMNPSHVSRDSHNFFSRAMSKKGHVFCNNMWP